MKKLIVIAFVIATSSVFAQAKKKSADEQAEIVGGEKVKVEAQNAVAEEEAAKCKVI